MSEVYIEKWENTTGHDTHGMREKQFFLLNWKARRTLFYEQILELDVHLFVDGINANTFNSGILIWNNSEK
jgi:hypothetical protein